MGAVAKVFVIAGPSGVGKGTLIGRLRERVPTLELSVSATTRPPRVGERDGVDYHFLDRTEFDARIAADQFVEWAEYSNNRYGTLRSELERRADAGFPVVLEIDLQGARQVAERMPAAVRVFVAPPDSAALRQRLLARATDSPEVIEQRLEVAEAELAAREEFPYVVVNDSLERATDELVAIVGSQLLVG